MLFGKKRIFKVCTLFEIQLLLLILCRLMHQFEHYLENIFEVCMLFNFTALQFHVFNDQLGHYLEGLYV